MPLSRAKEVRRQKVLAMLARDACRVGRHVRQVGCASAAHQASWPTLGNAPASLVMPAAEAPLAHRGGARVVQER
jgi:hypothetical protein